MSHPPSTRFQLVVVGLLAALLLGATAACSSTAEPTMPEDLNIATLPAPTDRANCTDPPGDISDSTQGQTGSLTEPAGIDIVAARADVGDNDMTVTFTTSGPVEDVVDPIFSVIQGVPGQKTSFELRTQKASNGTFAVALITWEEDDGRLTESSPAPLGVQGKVDGNELSFVVPLQQLPRIQSILWNFGGSGLLTSMSSAGERVFDDCNNMTDQQAPGSAVPTTSPTATTEPPSGDLGTRLESNDGIVVTAYAFERPAASVDDLAVKPEAGYDVGALDVEVCASEGDVTAQRGNFRVLTEKNELADPWDTPQAVREPAFPSARGTIPSGSCIRGWIAYELPPGSVITDVVFTPDTGGDGTGTVLWSV